MKSARTSYVRIRGYHHDRGDKNPVSVVVPNSTDGIREAMARFGLTDSRQFPRVTFTDL